MSPSTTSVPLSGCIIAFNEEDRIAAAIESLGFCDEVVVVDSHSGDRTREVAAAHGARVIERDWPGHVAQKEFAIRAASHDWVLCIDADERVTPELAAEIVELKARGFEASVSGPPGWSMPRLTRWMGAWIRHGTWYPDRQLRLFDRRRGHWGGHDPHDRVELEAPHARLSGDLQHETYRSLDDHLATIDKYTAISAKGLFERGRRAKVSDLWLRPLWRFLRFFVFKRGFLLGWRGLALAFLAAHYVRLKYLRLKILEAQGADGNR
jgi:glycosyltransferase involved in cell wall biosynthesis